MNSRTGSCALMLLLLVGCGSYQQDVQTICDGPNKATMPPEVNPADQATIIAAWIDPKLRSSKGKELFRNLPSVPPAERAKLLREAAKAQGISSCAFADFYDADAKR